MEDDGNDLLDRFWAAMTSFDFDGLRNTVTADFRCWYNTAIMHRQQVDLTVFISDMMEMELRDGMRVSIRDVRRHRSELGIIQQDIATVRRGDEAFEFARCHVIQIVGNRIARLWEYYDTASVLTWAKNLEPLIVMEPV